MGSTCNYLCEGRVHARYSRCAFQHRSSLDDSSSSSGTFTTRDDLSEKTSFCAVRNPALCSPSATKKSKVPDNLFQRVGQLALGCPDDMNVTVPLRHLPSPAGRIYIEEGRQADRINKPICTLAGLPVAYGLLVYSTPTHTRDLS